MHILDGCPGKHGLAYLIFRRDELGEALRWMVERDRVGSKVLRAFFVKKNLNLHLGLLQTKLRILPVKVVLDVSKLGGNFFFRGKLITKRLRLGQKLASRVLVKVCVRRHFLHIN